MFIANYQNSKQGSEALVLVAVQIVSFFCINPYLLSLVDWRNFMTEEAEALMHSSISTNKNLKAAVTVLLAVVVSAIGFGVLNSVIDTLGSVEIFIGMLFDNACKFP